MNEYASVHLKDRMIERAGLVFTQEEYADFISTIRTYGEFLFPHKKGDVYRVRYRNRIMYPVISFDDHVLTILSENMIREVNKTKNKRYKRVTKKGRRYVGQIRH